MEICLGTLHCLTFQPFFSITKMKQPEFGQFWGAESESGIENCMLILNFLEFSPKVAKIGLGGGIEGAKLAPDISQIQV